MLDSRTYRIELFGEKSERMNMFVHLHVPQTNILSLKIVRGSDSSSDEVKKKVGLCQEIPEIVPNCLHKL